MEYIKNKIWKTHQEKIKKKNEKEKKKLKMKVFSSFFFDKKHTEENSTALRKVNMEVEKCKGNKPRDL